MCDYLAAARFYATLMRRLVFSVSRKRAGHPGSTEHTSRRLLSADIVRPVQQRDQVAKLRVVPIPIDQQSSAQLARNRANTTRDQVKISEFMESARKLNRTARLTMSNADEHLLADVANQDLVRDFVNEFVAERLKDASARVIQTAFRSFRVRQRWKALLARRVGSARDLLRVVLYCWKLAVTNDAEALRSVFCQFSGVVTRTALAWGRRPVPFRLFYVTDLAMIPAQMEPEAVFKFTLTCLEDTAIRAFRAWHMLAAWRRRSRARNMQCMFGFRKRAALYPVYEAFAMWHLFAKWKRRSARRDEDGYSVLEMNEINIAWFVKEQRLNTKEARKRRADQAYARSLKKRGVKAIHTALIKAVTIAAANQSGDLFHEQHLQMQAYHAWLMFLQIKAKEKVVEREVVSHWYRVIYARALKQARLGIVDTYQKACKLKKILNGWYKQADMGRVANVVHGLKVQRRASTALYVIFLLAKNSAMALHIRCWKKWIQFVNARKRWRRFALRMDACDEETDTKYGVISELMRRVKARPMACIYGEIDLKKARYLGFSIDRVIRQLRADDNEAGHLGSPIISWKFETETATGDVCASSTVLSYALALRLHQLKPYDVCEYGKRKRNKQLKPQNPLFERLRTYDELLEQYTANRKEMRHRMRLKIARDSSILASVVSHLNALDYSAKFAFFTIAPKDLDHPIVETEFHATAFYNELDESEHELLSTIEGAPPRINVSYIDIRNQKLKELHDRLRSPDLLHASKHVDEMADVWNTPDSHVEVQARHPMFSPFKKVPASSVRKDKAKKYFTGQQMIDFMKTVTLTEMKDELMRFFNDVLHAQLASFDELVDFRNRDTLYADVSQSDRIQCTRNIQLFIAEFQGLHVSTNSIPKVDPTRQTLDIISVVLTFHSHLKSTRLAQYCADVAFSERRNLDDGDLFNARARLWKTLKAKWPQLEIPNSSHLARLRSSIGFATSIDQIPVLSQRGAYLTCFLVPHIIPPSNIADLLTTEL